MTTKCKLFFRSSFLVKCVMLSLFALWGIASGVQAQNLLKGVVTDVKGEPLPGVSVIERGTTNGTITDINGSFALRVKGKPILVFSYIGMKSQEVNYQNKATQNVVLQEDVAALDEVVVVAYGTQKRGSITGAISTVSDKEILKAPTMSISNIIGSRVAGISAVQSSGQPGSDNASLKIRGQSEGIIFVIDGIRRTSADFNGLDPNEIESISVLKDASAVSIYGLDASAAFVVTTKKGSANKMSISYTGMYGWSKNAEEQQWLDGPGYAYWYNKARKLDGDTEIFTQSMVDKMIQGVDGWGNTNWYKEVYQTGNKQNHNISVNGGTDKVQFFTSLGVYSEEGNVKNFNYDRYNLRTNVNAKLTNELTFTAGLSGRVEKRNSPRYTANPNDWHNIGQQATYAVPYAPIKMEYQGKEYYVSTPTASANVSPLGAINESGYSRSDYSYIQSNVNLRYDAPWLKGLSFNFQGAYDLTYLFGKTLSIPFKVMNMQLPTATTEKLGYSFGVDSGGANTTLAESASKSFNLTTQTSINYNNQFGKHKVGLLLLAETRQNKSNKLSANGAGLDFIQLDELDKITNLTGENKERKPEIGGFSGETRSAGFVGRLNYDYDNKYLLETSLRVDGSYLFSGMGKQWTTLPAVSLGWRMSEESWFDADFIENLKIRGGIGKTAISNVSAFQWQNTMAITPSSVMIAGASQSLIYAYVLGNPNLSWAPCLNYNIGFDATLWNGLLGLEADVFYKYEWDKIGKIGGSYPPSIGGFYYTYGNINKADYKGFDLTFTHRNHIGKFNYGAKLIWSYSFARWLKYSEDSENTPDYLKLTGKQIGAKKGFLSEGLFQANEEIANSPTIEGARVLPGYIKYTDRNGDGVISYAQDMGYVGRSSTPTHSGSFNLFGDFYGFDFDILFQWGLGHDVALTGIYESNWVMDNTAFTKPFYHGGNSPTYLVENAWTPDNTSGTFPRLSIVPVSTNNAYSSTFWYRKGDYLRLKTAQIGYNFPQKWLNSARIQALRLYVEGYNLLTFSQLAKFNIDPESPAVNNGYYPQQRTFSMGVKLTF